MSEFKLLMRLETEGLTVEVENDDEINKHNI